MISMIPESITQRQTSVPQGVQQQLRNPLEIQIGYAPISTQTATFTGYF